MVRGIAVKIVDEWCCSVSQQCQHLLVCLIQLGVERTTASFSSLYFLIRSQLLYAMLNILVCLKSNRMHESAMYQVISKHAIFLQLYYCTNRIYR